MKYDINKIPCIENTEYLGLDAAGFNWISESEKYFAFLNKIDSSMILFYKEQDYKFKAFYIESKKISPLTLDIRLIEFILEFIREKRGF